MTRTDRDWRTAWLLVVAIQCLILLWVAILVGNRFEVVTLMVAYSVVMVYTAWLVIIKGRRWHGAG